MNVNEYGVLIQVSTGFDMSAATQLQMVLTKPDGTVLTKTSPAVTAPGVDVTTTLGLFAAFKYAQYETIPGDIDQAGTWCVYIVYDDGPTVHLVSDVSHFTVNPNTC